MFSPQSPLLDPEFLRKLERLSAAPRRPSAGPSSADQRMRSPNLPLRLPERQSPGAGRKKRKPAASASLESVFARIFSQEDVSLHLLLDASHSMSFGTPTPKFQYARKMAAALGYAALLRYGRVDVGAFAQARGRRAPVLRGRSDAPALFSYLQSLRTGGIKDFSPAILGRLARVPRSAICVVFSDFLDSNWERSARALLDARSDIALVQVLAPEELRPPYLGHLTMVNAETRETRGLDVDDHWMNRYQDALDTFCGSIADLAKRYDMLYARTATEISFEATLLKTLRSSGSQHGSGEELS